MYSYRFRRFVAVGAGACEDVDLSLPPEEEKFNRMEHTPAFEDLRKTILLVDDEKSIVDVVSLFLRSQYNIIPANSGTQALQRSEQFNGEIHLLLVDSQMPGLKGSDLAVQITLQRPGIKVLLMSGSGEGLSIGAGWHFLAKPFNESKINRLIADIFAPSCERSC